MQIPDKGGMRNILSVSIKNNAQRADKYRERLIELYRQEKGKKIQYAEVFELCQYGRQACVELKKIFLIDSTTTNKPGKVNPSGDGTIHLSAQVGEGVDPKIAYMPEYSEFGWFTASDVVKWELEVDQAGKYDVYLEWSVADSEAGKPYVVQAGNENFGRR